jgi:hypothetical protein
VTLTSDIGRSAHLDLRVPDVGVLTTADVLQCFDRLRRQLSCALCGTEGFSLGYDDQEYCVSDLASLAPGTDVAVSAHVSDLLPDRHLVEYVATVTLPEQIDREPQIRRVARCRGWTSTGGTTGTGRNESAARHEDGATPR